MIVDKQLILSDAQAITTGTASSQNVIDQGVAGNAIGNELWLVARVGTAFAGGTSITISLQGDDNSGMSSPATLVTSPAIPLASLKANTEVWKTQMPLGAERYIGASVAASGTFTAGTLDLFFVPSVNA